MRIGYWKRVQSVVEESDLLLEIIDARFPISTRNRRVEKEIKKQGKKLALVLNKADLVSGKQVKESKKILGKRFTVVFVSVKTRKGIGRLRELVATIAGEKRLRIGVIGYPNTGKSSIINALTGKKRAKVSPTAGYTKGEQWIRVSGKIQMVDTPGVIPFEKMDEGELALLNAKTPEQLKDPLAAGEKVVEFFQKNYPEKFLEAFGVKCGERDAEEVLEELAEKKGKLLKGGKPDLNNVSKWLLKEWQRGKFG